MGLTSISDFLCGGLEDSSERGCLVGCLLLVICYVVALVWFEHADVPFEQKFFAQRAAVREERVRKFPIEVDRTIGMASTDARVKEVGLVRGWSAREPWGVWSDGGLASLAIDVPSNRAAPLWLVLECLVMLNEHGRQEVEAYVNGRVAGTWMLDRRAASLRIPLSAGTIPSTGLLVVDLDIKDPTTPPGGQDTRALGIGLGSVTVSDRPASAM